MSGTSISTTTSIPASARTSDTPTAGRRGISPPRRRWPYAHAAALLIAVGSWSLGFAIALPLIAAACLAGLLPAGSLIGVRATAAWLLILAWMPISIVVLHPFGAALDPGPTWLPVIVLTAVARWWLVRIRVVGSSPTETRSQLWTAAPLLIGAVAVAFLASAAFVGVSQPGRGVDQRMAIMAGSEDGASHYAIYDAILRLRDFAYGDEAMRYTAQGPYPPLFHIAAAELSTALQNTRGTSPNAGGQLDAFWLACLLVIGALVAMAAQLAAFSARAFGASRVVSAVGGLVCGAAVLFGLSFDLVLHGYFPQILALAVFLSILGILVADRDLGYRSTLLLVCIALAVTAWTWFFLVPVAAGCIIAWMWMRRPDVIAWWKSTIATLLLTGVAAFIPVYEMSRAVPAGTLNAGPGPTLFPSQIAWALVALALVLTLTMNATARNAARHTLLASLIVVSAFSILLYAYQRHAVGSGAYFFSKSMYTVLVVALAASVGATFGVLTRSSHRRRHTLLAVTLIAVMFSGLLGIRPDSRDSGAWSYRDGRSASKHRATFARYIAVRPRMDGKYLIAWGVTGDVLGDYYGTRWLSAMNGSSNATMWGLMSDTAWKQDDATLIDFIEKHPGQVAVFTGTPGLGTRLVREGLDPTRLTDPDLINTL
jgi:hypothetical protein